MVASSFGTIGSDPALLFQVNTPLQSRVVGICYQLFIHSTSEIMLRKRNFQLPGKEEWDLGVKFRLS